jgi:hypothetical protein
VTVSTQEDPWRARGTVICDMDGFVADTGVEHARARKRLFGDHRARRCRAGAIGSIR